MGCAVLFRVVASSKVLQALSLDGTVLFCVLVSSTVLQALSCVCAVQFRIVVSPKLLQALSLDCVWSYFALMLFAGITVRLRGPIPVSSPYMHVLLLCPVFSDSRRLVLNSAGLENAGSMADTLSSLLCLGPGEPGFVDAVGLCD